MSAKFKTYHLDHIVSIWYGYKNQLPTELISSTNNLRMIPYTENIRKGVSVNKDDVLKLLEGEL